jgi:oligo-1,6-glucosidase
MKRRWWKEAVIYQIYPRSFKDGDGDGVGDLQGILSALDYLSSLGVDTVWINPVYVSPGEDNGYDISDFRAIDPRFGTMDDLQRLIDGLHGRGMRIIMDMVVNHSSDEHDWFQLGRRSREDPHYGWYHWWPAEKGEPPSRCGFFDPKGKAWEYNAATDSYYLHYFSRRQPDLNWDNPELRQEIYGMLRFWLDKGIDGFRMDAISFISKDTHWPDMSAETLERDFGNDWGNYYASGPRLHDHLREMREQVLAGRDAVIIGESSGIPAERAHYFVGEDRGELDMMYQFEGISLGYLPGAFKKVDPAGYSVTAFREVYSRWDRLLEGKGWNTLYLGNHDQPRMVSRWGDDSDRYRERSAKLLFTFLLTMRGTPSLYSGDELGMTNIAFDRIDQYRDIETIHAYARLRERGEDVEAFLRDQQLTARDNGRTPFQWNAGPHAGFTTGEPWMPVNDNYRVVNREMEERDPDSVLWAVRRLLRFRRDHPVLVYGGYRPEAPEDPRLYAYRRWDEAEGLLVLLNFSGAAAIFRGVEAGVGVGEVLINNCRELDRVEEGVRLQPWQAVILKGGTPDDPG